jgi:hypothetical protein
VPSPPTPQPLAALVPAIAEAARRGRADALGLVDIGDPSGRNLLVDRACVTYVGGPVVGDPSSPLQLTCVVRGDHQVPAREVPPVVARIALGSRPLHLPDEGALRPPEPIEAVRGEVLAFLPEAVARVPAGALPVVTTTWALSRLPRARRPRFIEALDACRRPLAWVSVEGVGVAPTVPTLGDRPASGHSIVAVSLLDARGVSTDAVGRCWSRGRWLSWFAAPTPAG